MRSLQCDLRARTLSWLEDVARALSGSGSHIPVSHLHSSVDKCKSSYDTKATSGGTMTLCQHVVWLIGCARKLCISWLSHWMPGLGGFTGSCADCGGAARQTDGFGG